METNQDNKQCFFCVGGQKNNIILRWVLGIIILIVVFSFGIKLGKFASFMHQGYYGYGSSSSCGSMMQGYNYPRGIMWSDYYGR